MKQEPWTIQNPPAGAIPIELERLIEFGVPNEAIELGEMRGELETRGPWQMPVRYKALCTSCVWDNSKGYTTVSSFTIYGVRTLSNLQQSGYELEGRVSVKGGKKVRGFTSSQLFELPGGKLVNVAVIHACL